MHIPPHPTPPPPKLHPFIQSWSLLALKEIATAIKANSWETLELLHPLFILQSVNYFIILTYININMRKENVWSLLRNHYAHNQTLIVLCILWKRQIYLFCYNQDTAFPLLSPQASAHAGHLQPTHHPPSACLCFKPGPTPLKLSTDGHRAVGCVLSIQCPCVSHTTSLGIGGSEVEPRDAGVGYVQGDSNIIHHIWAGSEKEGQQQTNEPTSRLSCIVWLWLPGYLYVSLLQRRKPLLLDPDVRGRTDSNPTERWQSGSSGGSAAAELLCCHSGDRYLSPPRRQGQRQDYLHLWNRRTHASEWKVNYSQPSCCSLKMKKKKFKKKKKETACKQSLIHTQRMTNLGQITDLWWLNLFLVLSLDMNISLTRVKPRGWVMGWSG